MPITVNPELAEPKSRKQISLRKFILVPFFIFFGSMVTFLSVFSYMSAQKSIKEFQQTIAKDISIRVTAHLDRLFSLTSVVTHVNADFIRVGRLDPYDNIALQKHFINQIQHLTHLTFISFGGINGEYVGATRDLKTGHVRLMTSYLSNGMKVRTYDVDKDYNPTRLIKEGEVYKASECPWFVQAQLTGKTTWYPVYKYLPYDELGLGVTSPVYDKTGKNFVGAITADISLNKVSGYLKKLNLGAHGFAFITETNNNLLATTFDAPVYTKGESHTQRYTPSTYPDERMNFIAGFKDLADRPDGEKFFNIHGERYLINKQTYTDDLGLKMYVYIVLAEKDYLQSFNNDLLITACVFLVAAFIGLLIIFSIGNHLAKPIEELNSHVVDISEGNLKSTIKNFGNVTELNQLSSSFNTMAGKLSEVFTTMEQKIEERTFELNRANIKLLKMSNTDELTGIANRRHFNETLEKEWAHASRSRSPLTLLMLDVDFFKKYNDRYGHQAGDECLKTVATVIGNNSKRINDLAARYGGEEFAVVMPHIDISNALQVAENIRRGVEDSGLIHENSPFGRITISIGVATFIPDGKNTLEDLIRQADNALYLAKEKGRNRIEA